MGGFVEIKRKAPPTRLKVDGSNQVIAQLKNFRPHTPPILVVTVGSKLFLDDLDWAANQPVKALVDTENNQLKLIPIPMKDSSDTDHVFKGNKDNSAFKLYLSGFLEHGVKPKKTELMTTETLKDATLRSKVLLVYFPHGYFRVSPVPTLASVTTRRA